MSLATGGMGGPGGGLPLPTAVYPPGLLNTATLPSNNKQSLAAGQSILLPRGTYLVETGGYCQVQWLNPITQVWENVSSARMAVQQVISDGNNYRVANLTGCPVAAVVTAGGTVGYNQATTTVTASGSGGSQWQPIVGGQLGTTVTIPTAGSGYGLPPLVQCAFPPPPGVPATFTATIATGTVSAITCINQGAGYTANQTLSLVPDPFDPNFLAGTPPVAATAIATLVTASGTAANGKITAVLCVNPGASLTAAPTLTVSGASGGGTCVAQMLWTVTGLTVTNTGTVGSTNLITSVAGIPTVTAVWVNPATELTGYIPRQAQMAAAVASGTLVAGNTVSAIYDGGMFVGGTPSPLVLSNPLMTGTPTIAFIIGGTSATVSIQPVG